MYMVYIHVHVRTCMTAHACLLQLVLDYLMHLFNVADDAVSCLPKTMPKECVDVCPLHFVTIVAVSIVFFIFTNSKERQRSDLHYALVVVSCHWKLW